VASLLPSEIVRIKSMQVIKTDWVVVAVRMQHHAVRRQSVPSPISSPQASQRPPTSWKRCCFVASENYRYWFDHDLPDKGFKQVSKLVRRNCI
jgi:hypothetical protein